MDRRTLSDLLKEGPKGLASDLAFLSGDSEMGALIHAKDWSKTSLGPIEFWPHSLRTTVSICLASDLPICIIWGPDLVQIYNDGYRVICGEKHPRSMGQNFAECWREAWPVIGEAHDSALAGNTAFLENQHIFLERHGYVEECFFTFSFSPIRDESGRVVGLFHPVIEMTAKMLGERRTRALRDVTARTANAKTVHEACALAAQSLASQELDVPFSLTYVFDGVDASARLVASSCISDSAEGNAMSSVMPQVWPLAEVPAERHGEVVEKFGARFGDLRCGPYPESPREAVALPLVLPGAERPVGVLIAGVSGRLQLNQAYRDFYELLGAAVTTAVTNGRAFEEERKRAEALAEIDRAKTAFFSNVSHEFRTPLTLMLGPLEDALANAHGILPLGAAKDLDVSRRNALRLLKLVNTMLDFSRIEAGRMQVSYHATDLPTFTVELASNFRSACEKAGLKFVVDCPPFSGGERVYVDHDMWEKIVLNLLSNAFKFTLNGEIAVRLQSVNGQACLIVRDTGVGIPAEDLPRMFERFHRIEHSQGRTHEGTGIGLALVQELVKLHGGAVRVDSILGEGSTFTVTIPLGTAHLPTDRIGAPRRQASTATGVIPFVEEALRWLPSEDRTEDSGLRTELSESEGSALPGSPQHAVLDAEVARPRVLLADDNADMREYVSRLLKDRYEVVAVADGQAALEAMHANPPDLVLSDVMMPRLDGFGLLRAMRDNPGTRTIPVILLSARAGEESRVEGLEHGADDYLIKPFSARELLARVETHVKMARMRREAEQRVTTILESLTDGFHVIDAAGCFAYFNSPARRMFIEQGIDADTLIGKQVFDAFPDARELPTARAIQRTLTERVPAEAENFYAPWGRWFAARHYPTTDGGVSTFFQDITERKQVENALRESEERFRTLSEAVPAMVWICRADGYLLHLNQRWVEYTGQTEKEYQGYGWADTMHPEDRPRILAQWKRCTDTGELYEGEVRYRQRDGQYRWHYFRGVPLRKGGHIIAWYGTSLDIQEKKVTENTLRKSKERFDIVSDASEVGFWFCDLPFDELIWDNRVKEHFWLPQDANVTIHLFYERLHPDDRARTRQSIEVSIANNTRYDIEYRTVSLEGEEKWIRAVGRTFYDESEKPIRFDGVSMDVTERKRSEERLRHFTVELERRVAERTQELAQSEDCLRTLASELNLAEQRERKRLATELHDHLQQILVLGKLKLGQGKRLAEVTPAVATLMKETDDVLSEALTYTRTLVSDLSPTVLRDHGLAAALQWLGDYMQKHNQTVAVTVPDDEELKFPEDQVILLFQSVRELLINSAKHAGTGEATVRMEQLDGLLRIEVRDKGVGFDLAAASAAGTANGGISSKFGLFSIRERMRALGGSFEIESASGKGTMAVLTLPLRSSAEVRDATNKERHVSGRRRDGEAAVSLPTTQSSALQQHVKRVRVLLIDDHIMIRQGLRSVLDAYADIELVGEAGNGEEAVQLVDQLRPAVVVMDINMPKMNGIEATREIKTHYPDITVIGLSVNASGENQGRMLEVGAATLLTKEAAVEELYEVIMRHVERARESDPTIASPSLR